MIALYTFSEIETINTVSEAFKAELGRYFREIAEGIVGDAWKDYNLEEVGPILVIEQDDTVVALEEYGLMEGSKTLPIALPEFAVMVEVDGKDMLRIIWLCNDSYGLSVYYPIGQFGKEFDEYAMRFLME